MNHTLFDVHPAVVALDANIDAALRHAVRAAAFATEFART